MEWLWGSSNWRSHESAAEIRDHEACKTREGLARGHIEEAAVPMQAALSYSICEGVRTDYVISDTEEEFIGAQ